MEASRHKLLFWMIFGTTLCLVNCSCDFTKQLEQINKDLHVSHETSLDYLTSQQSILSKIVSEHNADVIAEAANSILFLKSMESQGMNRLNRKTELKQQCWLHNFHQLNAQSSDNLAALSNCINENLASLNSLSNTYFHTMVDELLYQSALGTTNALYAIGQYNPLTDQTKIMRTLEGTVKFSTDGWSGTKDIVEGEVQKIKQGLGVAFGRLEECQSKAVKTFLNKKIDIARSMDGCKG